MHLQRDIERDAVEMFSAAKCDPCEGPAIAEVCRRLIGRAPEWAPLRSCEAAFCILRGQPRVYVRKGIMPARARWLAGHELAHWWYQNHGLPAKNIEDRCDRLGAALVAPAPVVVDVLKRTSDVRKVARAMATTQSLAALRMGEVAGVPVALVSGAHIRVRGRSYPWPQGEILSCKIPSDLPARILFISDEPKRLGYMVA
jgi:hypothetical protein